MSAMRSIRSRLGPLSVSQVVTFFVVAASVLFTFSQLQPQLLFMDSLTAGGDMGAHVWGPQYLRDHLLPHGRITGWTPDWYAGFPALHFYFPLPLVLVALIDTVIPYTVAFKLVTVSGALTLPIAAWAFGRLAGLPFPAPACLAAATVPFLFDTGYSILGGNIASTLAGEFAFSVGLSLSFVLLGFVIRGLRTGRHRGVAALLFGLVVLTHILPTIFAFVGGLLLVIIATIEAIPRGRAAALRPLRWAVPAGLVGALVSAFWLLPFVGRRDLMNDMGWEKIGGGVESGMKLYEQTIVEYSDALFPGPLAPVLVAGFAGAALALYFRRRVGMFLVLVAAVSATAFIVAPQGQLWNARLLPFWYLSLYLLAGLLVAEIGWGIADALRPMAVPKTATDDDTYSSVETRSQAGAVANALRLASPLVALALALVMVVPRLPAPEWWPEGQTAPFHDGTSSGQSYIPGWATWNYSGYDGKRDDGSYYKPAHTELRTLVETMGEVGRTHGCGRAMWEYESALDRFGTPMALMLLPTWTDGCIGSMEGLFFESSATVPYHFLNQALMSKQPSSAMRDLPYGTLDVAAGVTRLQLLGVRYYLAVTPDAQAQAATDPRLEFLVSVPAAADTEGVERTWNAYRIADSELIEPLATLPAVMTDEGGVVARRDGTAPGDAPLVDREAWLENSLAWYGNPTGYTNLLAADGPPDWPRVPNAESVVDPSPAPPAQVTYTATGDDRISFSVDRPGTPVLVKASYFPNWKVEGANGPYRVTPNLMVVVPTQNHVSMRYGRTPLDWLGVLGTVLGIAGVVWLWRHPLRRPRRPIDFSTSRTTLTETPEASGPT